jgi:CHAT domain-containing protein
MLRGTAKGTKSATGGRELLHEDVSQNVQKDSPFSSLIRRHLYAHPYYWAPFFLMGNWL